MGTIYRTDAMVTVAAEFVADGLTPVAAFTSIVGDAPGFLFESVEGGERWGRYSFVGRRPLAKLVSRNGQVTATGTLPDTIRTDAGMLAAIDDLMAAFMGEAIDDLPPLARGLVGYLGYDVVREVERLPHPPTNDLGHPDSVIMLLGEVAIFDHWRQRIIVVVNELAAPGDDVAHTSAPARAIARHDALVVDCFTPAPRRAEQVPAKVDPGALLVERTMSSAEFQRAVLAAKEYITIGDIFQVVLSQRIDFELDAEPFDVYRALRLLNPSPYLYFLRLEELTVAGSSPEPLVRVRDGVVISRPIAGSRPRGATEEDDARLGAELREDPKEVAEHVMLIDLARNDLGRVVQFGTETVDEVMVIERYSHIMHLTSQVSGRLDPSRGPIDVLRATLPAGTLSGAPKVRAMEIIDELEPTRRGVYGGVIGYLDFQGNLDTAIAIRTLVVTPDGRASVQAGAGIVADSDPATEDAECLHKMAAVRAAVVVARSFAAQRDAK